MKNTAIRNGNDPCRQYAEELTESSLKGSANNIKMGSCINQCSDRIVVNVKKDLVERELGGDITSPEEWSQQLKQIQELYTREVDRTEQAPEVDKRLLGLWEARRGLTKRWKKQRMNKELKKKIAEITKKAEEYATQLARQGWQQFTDSLNGALSTARTWQILRGLLDPSKSKRESSNSIQRLIHLFQGTDEQLLEEVRKKCYGTGEPEGYRGEYRGEDNPDIDRPISREEVVEVIRSATKNTAAGADRVRNSLIRNLSDGAIDQLVKYLNTLWQEGKVPAEWKHAIVVMIPKPGKKIQIENLRPISLTSCLGKLYEKIVTKRIQRHLENGRYYPNSMFGFRANLSTQDVLLQLEKERAPLLAHELQQKVPGLAYADNMVLLADNP
nr:uncharacterized protein LOC126540138 [Dermacentor andersoni]